MYQVLLVDDEELDLEGMRRFIPWNELGMEVAGTANNALTAREMIESRPIDILVSDVNMPYMSGLELARVALEKAPNLRIIFVSGYQEFSYVQQALSLKAYNYVLKPMEDAELIETLKKVKQDLEEANKQREVEASYRRMIPIAKSDLLIRLLEGESEDGGDSWEKLADTYGLNKLAWPARVAVMEMDKLTWEYAEAPIARLETSRILLEQVNRAAEACGNVPYCKLSAQRVAFVLEDGGFDRHIATICETVRRRLPVSLTTGVGEPAAGLPELHRSYRQAIEAVEGKMFLGKGTIIAYEAVRSEPEMLDARALEDRMEALFKAMTDYDLVRIYDEFENLFQSLTNLRSKFTVLNMANFIVWKLEQRLSSINENLFELLDLELHNLDILLQFETINDIRSWLVHRVYEISERLYRKSNSSNGKFMRSVIEAIKERIGENVTLKDFAKQFPFSPSYLGFLIKEKSGQTFNELIVQMRMEKACELLKEPGIKIYEVADQVGYRYLPYFSRQFKEKFGMTPVEYRKKEQ
ncbi:response regulator [Paenibacillaceae bacterium WGS1546]|uniref:response regulator n=1 Tax=Cohnella sp. WGS1546 TaxID=3366810 RepID=UPI00372D67B9